MCDTISCQRKHDFQNIANGNIIIKPKEFLSLVDCFIKERNYIVFLQFNKIRNILQLEYARIFANLNEARDMNVFLF